MNIACHKSVETVNRGRILNQKNMNIIIDTDKDFITGFNRIRASITIGNYKHSVIANLNEKPFYMSDSLYVKKTILQLKKDLETYLSDKITPIH